MFERFTEAARHVVVRAQDEARELNHSYIGTEHMLLALTVAADEVPAQALAAFGVTEKNARTKVIEIVGLGVGDPPAPGRVPFTSRAKKMLELALRESLSQGHNSIRPGHLLLGLLRDDDGVAVRILIELKVAPRELREQVIERLAAEPDEQPPGSGRRESTVSVREVGAANELRFVVRPDRQLERLLMAAGGRALANERREFGLADLLAVIRERPDANQLLDDGA